MSTVLIAPHDIPAERAVLGFALSGAEALAVVRLRLPTDALYLDNHRQFYELLMRLADRGDVLTPVLVAAEVRGTPEESVVRTLLAELPDEAAALFHVGEYLTLLLERAAQRELLQLALTMQHQASLGMASAQIIESATTAFGRLIEHTDPTHEQAPEARGLALQPLGAVLTDTVTEAQFSMPDLVPTPIRTVNEAFAGGFARGELVVLGGLPGSAKSALMLELARYAADPAHGGHGSWLISIEMGRTALGSRLLSQNTQVPASAFRGHDLGVERMAALERILPTLAALPIWLTDEVTHLSQIQRLIKRAATADELPRLLFLDYLQLLEGPRSLDRRLEVSYVTKALKRLAVRHGLTVVALSSITPPPPEPGRKPRRPTMRNLRESRDIDHAADIVLMLWQPTPEGTDRELWIDKGRDGAAGGHATLDFSPAYLRFQERP